jgi:hypothetical protein
MLPSKSKEKLVAEASSNISSNNSQDPKCKVTDEKRVEKVLVLIHWQSETETPKHRVARTIPHNMGFPAPDSEPELDTLIEQHTVVGMIYGVRLFEEEERPSQGYEVPWKVTKWRVLIVTSDLIRQGLVFRGPNTAIWSENPFTRKTYRIAQSSQIAADSGICIILCDEWNQEETKHFDIPELSARREHPDRDRDSRYISLMQDAITQVWHGHKLKATFRKTWMMGAAGSWPPISGDCSHNMDAAVTSFMPIAGAAIPYHLVPST